MATAAYVRLSHDNVVRMGANEMNLPKGCNYLTVFANLFINRVLFTAKNHDG